MKEEAKDRSWIWQSEDWTFLKGVDEGFIARAKRIDKAEEELLTLCLGLSAEDAAWMFANDVLSNWGIEDIRLSRKSIRDSLSSILNFAHSSPVQEAEREKNAAEATYEALSENSPLSLEHILSLHAKLKSDDAEDWGVLRDHSESVYGVDLNGHAYSVYNAPPHEAVPGLMEKFTTWWNGPSRSLPRSAASILAHLHFVTIHPFRDGNGRMARILADKRMASGSPLRMYSISYEIEKNKTAYYMALESITPQEGMGNFLDFMLSMYAGAIEEAKSRSSLLLKAYAFLQANEIFLSDGEKELLRMLSSSKPGGWSFIEATRYMDDGEEAQAAWKKFQKIGLLDNGQLLVPEIVRQASEVIFQTEE